MMLKRLLAAVAVLSFSATGLHAADFYLGAGLSGYDEAGSFRHGLGGRAETDDEPWKLFAGVKLGRHLAVEVSRYDFGVLMEVDGVSATALGRWPLGRFTPFVKAGVLYWKEDGTEITIAGAHPSSADGTDLLVGAGLDVDLPAHFTVRADWERYQFGDVESDGFWASLFYRF